MEVQINKNISHNTSTPLNYKNNIIFVFDITESWEPSEEQEILINTYLDNKLFIQNKESPIYIIN